MIIILLVFIFISNLISGIFGGNKFVFYISVLVLVFLFGGVYDIADEENYKFFYNNVRNDTLLNKYSLFASPGWYLCNYISITFNFSFEQFRLIIGAFSIFLISKSITKFSANSNITLVLFLIFPFIIDNVQIRNFFACSIFLYSLRFLNKNNRYNLTFLIFTLIASSIHQTFIFFIPFIFFYKLNIKKIFHVTTSLIILFIIIIQSNYLLYLAETYLNKLLFAKISIYLYNAKFGFLALWFLQIGFVYITYKTQKIYRIKKNGVDKRNYDSFLDSVVKLNFYSLILVIPLVMLDGTYFRIFRNLLLCNFIVNSYLFVVLSKKRYLYFLAILILNFLILNLSINTPLNIETVVKPFLNNNLYLN